MSNEHPIHVSAQCNANFVRILRCYKFMKQIKQIELIVILLLAMVPFSYGIGLTALFLTIALCLDTMIYLVVSQENIISEMQRALYQMHFNTCLFVSILAKLILLWLLH